MAKRLFDFFVFGSFYIACCAVFMVHQANQLLHLHYDAGTYLLFVFFSTLCSYNFHWYLTPDMETAVRRIRWTQQHKTLHLVLFGIGLAGAGLLFFYFIQHWIWMAVAALLTFMYSAPKMPLAPFGALKKIAVGKTIFLSFVWMYVTTFLPVIFSGKGWQTQDVLFCISRFFLIYPICIIFDYRDRLNDKQQGIRSLITHLSDSGITRLFYLSLFIFLLATVGLWFTGFKLPVVILLLIPGIVTLALYHTARHNFSDYLYYVVLDGLMMFSALFTPFLSI